MPQLWDAWIQCRSTFGSDNVLIVSNSAGTQMDPGGIQVNNDINFEMIIQFDYSTLTV